MKKNQLKRQGDVALVKINSLPSGLTSRKMTLPASTIVARGENSNHCHAVVGKQVSVAEDSKGNIYVSSEFEFELKHLLESNLITGAEVWTQEHTALKFPAGNYVFRGQTEYHPYEDEIRRVQD